ncbi:hypothetical protein NARC_30160 [Candidatus Nitrosocosmicus arcticus]|uniref:Uncharacterized protein n=1 Tax=Candidatus Nitrosocosmicus arcticus TaxID=2035267 RepID=A0A557SXW5_9ARCH|nr:hypothetical protein NARC_30160 [Candidatus Nitrosocosmicus arcticus]
MALESQGSSSIYAAMKIINLISTFYKRPIIKNLTNNNEDEFRSGKKNHIKRRGRDSNPGQGSDSPPYWTGLYNARMHFYTTPALQILSLPKPIKTFVFY